MRCRCGHLYLDHDRSGRPSETHCRTCPCVQFVEGEADGPVLSLGMLMVEIRRALEATHPDRAGLMMSRLEEFVPRLSPTTVTVKLPDEVFQTGRWFQVDMNRQTIIVHLQDQGGAVDVGDIFRQAQRIEWP